MFFVIDSMKRDTSLYPNSNSFRYKTTKMYSNINLVTLFSAQLFTSDYVINAYNNSFSITKSSVVYVCTLTKGNWNASSYATQLQTDLNNVSNWTSDPSLTFTVTYSSSTNKYTISAGSAFNINFDTSYKLATKLGFSRQQTSSASSHVSGGSVQFINSRYYDIRIYELLRDSSENLNNCFARVWNTVQANELIDYQSYRDYFNITHDMTSTVTFPQELKIEIYDENNDLVDNNNSEFVLMILLK
jgi:hypothetical protein